MKRLLLPRLAALALPTAVNAQVEVKPAVSDFSIYLYKHLELEFSLVNSLERISNIFYDDHEELYKCIDNAKNDIEKGKLFSYGIKKCPFYFSKKIVRIIEKGEKNGLLIEVFRDFSDVVAVEKFNKDDSCEIQSSQI